MVALRFQFRGGFNVPFSESHSPQRLIEKTYAGSRNRLDLPDTPESDPPQTTPTGHNNIHGTPYSTCSLPSNRPDHHCTSPPTKSNPPNPAQRNIHSHHMPHSSFQPRRPSPSQSQMSLPHNHGSTRFECATRRPARISNTTQPTGTSAANAHPPPRKEETLSHTRRPCEKSKLTNLFPARERNPAAACDTVRRSAISTSRFP